MTAWLAVAVSHQQKVSSLPSRVKTNYTKSWIKTEGHRGWAEQHGQGCFQSFYLYLLRSGNCNQPNSFMYYEILVALFCYVKPHKCSNLLNTVTVFFFHIVVFEDFIMFHIHVHVYIYYSVCFMSHSRPWQTGQPMKTVVVSISPQSRASLAAQYHLNITQTNSKLHTFFKSLGGLLHNFLNSWLNWLFKIWGEWVNVWGFNNIMLYNFFMTVEGPI